MTAGRIQRAWDQTELGCMQLGGRGRRAGKPGSAANEVKDTKGAGKQNSSII